MAPRRLAYAALAVVAVASWACSEQEARHSEPTEQATGISTNRGSAGGGDHFARGFGTGGADRDRTPGAGTVPGGEQPGTGLDPPPPPEPALHPEAEKAIRESGADAPPPPAPRDAPPVGTEAEARFRAGFLDAGGDPAVLDHVVWDVITDCEWLDGFAAPWVPGNGYLSRAQFHPDTWGRAGGGDPWDDYQVGGNVARWIARVDEGTSAGWPVCWHRGGW